MRPKLLFNLGRALAACLLASHAAAAQGPPAPADGGGLVVRVEYLKGAKPAFQPVPNSTWFGRFGVVATPRPRAAADTVLAVDVQTRAGGRGRVEITVGVHVGERHFDRFEEVGKYSAAEGETVTAVELERVGVAPFVFSVLRVGEASAAPPAVVNQTRSIEAAVTDFTPSPLPRGTLTLRNLSPKRVRAVYVRQVVEGRDRLVGFVARREGRTVMEPGGTVEKQFGVTSGEATRSGFTPVTVESLVVASVVFEDYTHEGDDEPAAWQAASAEADRALLPRLTELVREAHAAPDADSADAPRRLRERVRALRYETPRAAVDAVFRRHPGLDAAARERVSMALGSSMHRTRRDLLDDLEAFEKASAASPAGGGFKGWLRERQARLEGWLARL